MTRHATIRTTHDDPELLARALEPDNTEEMETTIEGARTLVTRIERETTGGLQSTVDDYVVNLDVACSIDRQTPNPSDANSSADGRGVSTAARSDTNHEPNTQ
ncbi:KEOPS complex Pcc1-like subunit [Halostagnicola sp. A56]|uniref:KEOPS complex subunit Pcc1 n=1 Tax=Halostagnicola sp. A56 TaxID=1495067 RepID=UPI0004A122F5|nr:KEOPS complex subunit Pcc1 [Halostagnicola sp. A56]KDE58484.1 KEOPS complex Pcc1-like subunit [Halostagnicola sp. A56]